MPGSEKEYKYWDKLARTFHEDSLYVVRPNIHREIREWLAGEFSDKDTVLELGCGSGLFSEMIVDRVKHLVATDLSQGMLEKARERLSQYSNVEVQIEDCYDTSFMDNMFDVVMMGNLLHIVMDPIVVLKESRRVLKDDGKVVIADVTGYGMPFLRKVALGFRYMKKWHSPAPYSRNFSPDEVIEIAKEAGFAVEESKLIGEDTKAVCLRGWKMMSGDD